METQIRIITTKRGYANIVKDLKIFKNEEIIKELINENTCQFYGKYVFLKWDNPTHHKMIETIIMFLMNRRNSFKICEIYEESINTYCRDIEGINLPMPVMKCKFKDEETVKKLCELQPKRRNGVKKNGI